MSNTENFIKIYGLSIDYDILDLHEKILKKLNTQTKNIKCYETKLLELKKNKNIYGNSEKIFKLSKKIDDIKNGAHIGYYLINTNRLIDRYNEIKNQSVKISFSSGKVIRKNTEQIKIINRFLEIAKEYINIENNIKKISVKKSGIKKNKSDDSSDETGRLIKVSNFENIICSSCSYLNKTVSTSCENKHICKKCGVKLFILNYDSHYQDTKRVSMSQKYIYTVQIHMNDVFKKYVGKQNTTIPDEVKIAMDNKRESLGIPKDKLTKKHLEIFMSMERLTYKNDINKIHSELTGKPAPNVFYLEEKYRKLIDIIVVLYYKYKPPDRESFMNSQYALYRCLKLLGCNCDESEFALPEKKIINKLDIVWGKMMRELKNSKEIGEGTLLGVLNFEN